MFVIGIDPHKRSHTAAVLDDTEELVGQLRVTADRWQRDRLLRFAAPFEPRTWAVEAAGGLGALLAQQLVAAGERVVDVPPTLSARVRLLDSGRTDKSDPHDARSAAIVALRHARLRPVRPVDHSAVLRLLANRHHDLTASRTRTICRLHALLCLLIPGGFSGRLSARQAGQVLRGLRPVELVDVERRRIALELLADVRRIDDQLEALVKRIGDRGRRVGHHRHRRLRHRTLGRRADRRPHRRRDPVPERRSLRPLQRDRTTRSIIRTARASPAQPAREPSAEPRVARRRDHPDRARHSRPRLLPPQDRRKARPAKKRSAH